MTMQQQVPGGRREEREGREWMVLTRTFRAPVEDVWAAVTEPDRLARWFATWEGDPATGQVTVRVLYEGDDAAPEVFTIDECAPPHRLAVRSTMPAEDDGPRLDWHVHLDLSEDDGVTTLVFAQSLPYVALGESMGPGWEYYLDRLVAAETGGDPATVRFDDYYPAQAPYYRELFARR